MPAVVEPMLALAAPPHAIRTAAARRSHGARTTGDRRVKSGVSAFGGIVSVLLDAGPEAVPHRTEWQIIASNGRAVPPLPHPADGGSVHLKTLGHPVLFGGDGQPVGGMRKKDLALLVYLCVDQTAVHPRGRLASLLWGGSPDERARHSLTQALGRLTRTAPGVLAVEKDVVRRGNGLGCDAVRLLGGSIGPAEVDDTFSVYPGPFLQGFDPGRGAEELVEWADRRRAELRDAALCLLARACDAAAAAGDWGRALRLAERAVEIDPVWEQGHRRLMQAQAARGERNRALWHYHIFEAWLAAEVGAQPDPETRALAELLRAPDAPSIEPSAAPLPTLAEVVGGREEEPVAIRSRASAGRLWLAVPLILIVLLAVAVRGCGG
jgi:DNA-binding SARP family transcriptional activator